MAPDYRTFTKVFLTPMPQENQRCRDCVKPSALSHEHGKRNAFPGDFFASLIIQNLEVLKNLKASYPAVEQKTCHTKGAAPSEKRIKRCQRTKQSSPNQS